MRMKKEGNAAQNDGVKSVAKWLSRLFLLFSAGLLLYVSLLCYPSWPSDFTNSIQNPKQTRAYAAFCEFSDRLKQGDGVIAAFSESYQSLSKDLASD